MRAVTLKIRRFDPDKDQRAYRATYTVAAPRLLAAFSETLARKAQQTLEWVG